MPIFEAFHGDDYIGAYRVGKHIQSYLEYAGILGVKFNMEKQIVGSGYGEYLKKMMWPDG